MYPNQGKYQPLWARYPINAYIYHCERGTQWMHTNHCYLGTQSMHTNHCGWSSLSVHTNYCQRGTQCNHCELGTIQSMHTNHCQRGTQSMYTNHCERGTTKSMHTKVVLPTQMTSHVWFTCLPGIWPLFLLFCFFSIDEAISWALMETIDKLCLRTCGCIL